MRKSTLSALILSGALALAGCAGVPDQADPAVSPEGAVRIALTQDAGTTIVATKADGEELPSIDDFEVEIYSSKALRLYRKPYAEAKTETIKLNAGEFRLVAHHGDTLGAGFGKAYYLADEPFTVHGYVENNEQPDEVTAVARLGNVKVAVEYGSKIKAGYSDFYAVVRNERYAKKSVKFAKNETRAGYIPGGNLYLEVYAHLGGSGSQEGGESKWVYYKSESAQYNPADFVTFKVEAGPREGTLVVNISIDKTIETVNETIEIPASALPTDPPVFSYGGASGDEFTYEYTAGIPVQVKDAILSWVGRGKIGNLKIDTDCPYLTGLGLPASVDVVAETDKQASVKALGLNWITVDGSPFGCVDFSGLVQKVITGVPFDSSNPVSAKFTVTASDIYGKTSTATFNFKAVPVNATVSALDYNIWGWKVVAPRATLTNATYLPSGTNIKLQYSADGNTWSTVNSKAINGNVIDFADATGLTAGVNYSFRTIVNDDPGNVSDVTVIKTEDPQQVGNNGFESFKQMSFTTPVAIVSDFDVTWWRLYADGEEPWWSSNAPVGIRSTSVAAAYQDFKTFPLVSLTKSGSYSGNSLMIATIFTGSSASRISAGDTHHAGEVFIGTSNDAQQASWAKTSDGHAFANRPSALTYYYKFTRGGSTKNYVVSVKVFASDGTQIGSGYLADATAKGSWTLGNVPISYTVTDKKAASIQMFFRSSIDGGESYQSLTGTNVNTLSGDHTIHVGNILYLDNITLKYE